MWSTRLELWILPGDVFALYEFPARVAVACYAVVSVPFFCQQSVFSACMLGDCLFLVWQCLLHGLFILFSFSARLQPGLVCPPFDIFVVDFYGLLFTILVRFVGGSSIFDG